MSKEFLVATKDVTVGELSPHKKQLKEDGSPVNVIACTVDGSAYVESLGRAGLDMKTVKAVQTHDSEYLTQLQKDAATAGAELLKKNPEADRVVFVAPYGSDKLTKNTSSAVIEVDRSKKILNVATKEVSYQPAIKMDVINKFQKNGDAIKKELKQILQDKLADN